MTTKDKFPHYWICCACAKSLGGIPSMGVSTAIRESCKYCNGENQLKNEYLLPWVDFEWPGEAGEFAMASRD